MAEKDGGEHVSRLARCGTRIRHEDRCEVHEISRSESATGAPLRSHEVLGLFLAELLHSFLDQQRCELHRFDVDSVLANLGRHHLELFQRLWRQWS